MATNKATLSRSRVQSLSDDLAAVHAWTLLKAICGHSRPFFGGGPFVLPMESRAPILPVLPGMVEVAL